MTRGHLYSLEAAWITRLNGSGQSTGQLNPDSLGVGPTLSPAFLLKGMMTLKTAKATRSTVEWHGSGAPEGKKQVGVDSIGDAELTVTQWDSGLNAFLNGGLVDTTTLTGAEISAQNNMNPSPNVVAFCGIVRLDDPDTVGAVRFMNIFYPNCQLSSDSPDLQQVEGNQKNPNPITIKITPDKAESFPTGVAFGAAQDWYNNSEFCFNIVSDWPYFMDVWVADGIATTFNLTYLPKYSGVTGGKTNNWVTKAGTPTAPTSISTTTKAVVIAAAGSASDLWNCMYPVNPKLLI